MNRSRLPIRVPILVLIALLVLGVSGIVWAQVSANYDNSWRVLSAGGSQGTTSGAYTIHGTSGQFAIGPASDSQRSVGSGYWYGIRPHVACEPVTSVDFDWSPPAPGTGEVVTFTVTSVLPLTARLPITYEWSFGDGDSATGNPVYHTYVTGSIYSVNVTATNECGGPVWMSHTLTVTGVTDYWIYLPLTIKND